MILNLLRIPTLLIGFIGSLNFLLSLFLALALWYPDHLIYCRKDHKCLGCDTQDRIKNKERWY